MLIGYTIKLLAVIAKLHSAVGSGSDCRGHKFESQLRHINFVEIARETIATVILPFRGFKNGSCQLLVSTD